MEFGKRHAKFRSFQQSQIDLILTVKQGYINHLVKRLIQLGFHRIAQAFWSHHNHDLAGGARVSK